MNSLKMYCSSGIYLSTSRGNSRDLVLICRIKWMLSFHTLDIWLKKQFSKEIFRQLEMRRQNYAWVQAWKNNGIHVHWIVLWRPTTVCAYGRLYLYESMSVIRSYIKILLAWSFNVASGSEITPCNKIDKPLMVYRISGNVAYIITKL